MGVSYARVTNTTRPVAKVHPRFGLRGDTLGHTTHLIQVQECIFDLQLPQLLAGGRPGIHTVQTDARSGWSRIRFRRAAVGIDEVETEAMGDCLKTPIGQKQLAPLARRFAAALAVLHLARRLGCR